MRETVYDTLHFKADLDARSRIVFLIRRAHEYADVKEIHAENQALAARLDAVERPKFGLMVDLRLARGRDDAEFNAAQSIYRKMLVERFRAVAFLVGTPEGKAQLERIIIEHRITAGVAVHTEEEALRYLLKTLAAK